MTITYVGDLSVRDLLPAVAQVCTLYGAFNGAYASLREALDAFADILVTVDGGLDFVLTASFGLVPLRLNAMMEFQGALKAQAELTLAISNPLAQAIASITAMSTALANLQASLALGLPTISAELSMQLSAVVAVAAAASAKMAGITAVIDAVGSVQGPVLNGKLMLDELVGSMDALLSPLGELFSKLILNLNVGGSVHAYTAVSTASMLGQEVGAFFSTGVPGVPASSAVKALLFVVDTDLNPSTWGGLSFLVRTTP